MDRFHEFRMDINDYSMCQCGIPAYYHEQWEREQAGLCERLAKGSCAASVDGYCIGGYTVNGDDQHQLRCHG